MRKASRLASLLLFFCVVARPVKTNSQTCNGYTECPCRGTTTHGFVDLCVTTEDAKCFVANYLDQANSDLNAAKTTMNGAAVKTQKRFLSCPQADADWNCYKSRHNVGGANDVAAAKAHFFSAGYLLKLDPSCSTLAVKKFSNWNRYNGDLQHLQSQTEDSCVTACRNSDDCLFVNFKTSTGECWLKNGGGGSAGGRCGLGLQKRACTPSTCCPSISRLSPWVTGGVATLFPRGPPP